jgi:hypothetical protein
VPPAGIATFRCSPCPGASGPGDIHPVELHVGTDQGAGLVVPRVVEPRRPEVDLVLGASAAIDAALRIVAAVGRLKELWRDP